MSWPPSLAGACTGGALACDSAATAVAVAPSREPALAVLLLATLRGWRGSPDARSARHLMYGLHVGAEARPALAAGVPTRPLSNILDAIALALQWRCVCKGVGVASGIQAIMAKVSEGAFGCEPPAWSGLQADRHCRIFARIFFAVVFVAATSQPLYCAAGGGGRLVVSTLAPTSPRHPPVWTAIDPHPTLALNPILTCSPHQAPRHTSAHAQTRTHDEAGLWQQEA